MATSLLPPLDPMEQEEYLSKLYDAHDINATPMHEDVSPMTGHTPFMQPRLS